MCDVTVDWHWQGPRSVTVSLDIPDNAAKDAPLVVLLHGTGGDIHDMSDPAVHPRWNYERVALGTIQDRGRHDYPNVGYWSVGIDPLVPVEGWAPFLNANGFPTLNYGQVGQNGENGQNGEHKPFQRLPQDVAELRAILDAIEARHKGGAELPGFEPVKDRRIVMIGHSRGGIVARQALVDMAATSMSAVARISTLITLHSPNLGSTLANTAIAASNALPGWRAQLAGLPAPAAGVAAAIAGLDHLLAMVESEASAPAYQDYSVGSPVLGAIAAAEPVPGIEYHTFGGLRPVVFNVRGWAFTLGSAIPEFQLPPFHWETGYQVLMTVPPPVLLLPELTAGIGDLLVAAPMARLPFSFHLDNWINHAEALWDPALKIQVLAILRRGPLPSSFVITCVTPDSTDPDRTIDGLGGVGPTGAPWRLSTAEALVLADRGAGFFVRRNDGTLAPLQRVRRRDGRRCRRHFRTLPGGGGPRLQDLPTCLA